MHGLLLPKDINYFSNVTKESLARQLQWHTIAITLLPFTFHLFRLHVYFLLPYTCEILLLLCYQAAQLTHILDEWLKELVEDVEREKAFKRCGSRHEKGEGQGYRCRREKGPSCREFLIDSREEVDRGGGQVRRYRAQAGRGEESDFGLS